VMMIPGELDFNDVMYSSEKKAYYDLGYIMFILFVICMTIITMNLLTGTNFFDDRICMYILIVFSVQNRLGRR
jgi:hypothetical protein